MSINSYALSSLENKLFFRYSKCHSTKCSTSVASREMQNHGRYHFTPIRMTLVKNMDSEKCWWECEDMLTLILCLWVCKMVQLFWKTVWQFLENLNRVTVWPSSFISRYIPQKIEIICLYKTCLWMFMVALFIEAPKVEITQNPVTVTWINKMRNNP